MSKLLGRSNDIQCINRRAAEEVLSNERYVRWGMGFYPRPFHFGCNSVIVQNVGSVVIELSNGLILTIRYATHYSPISIEDRWCNSQLGLMRYRHFHRALRLPYFVKITSNIVFKTFLNFISTKCWPLYSLYVLKLTLFIVDALLLTWIGIHIRAHISA